MTERAAKSNWIAVRELLRTRVARQPAELTLSKIVAQVANAFETDVGSLYVLQRDGNHLLLAATVGLLQTCVGQLRMQLDEGLVGLVAEQRAPVVLAEAPRHPRFKYFPEADEDRYQSFLGVPILDSSNLRGVLVVQTIEPRQFTSAETGNLAQVAALLGRHWSSILDRDV